MGDYEIKSVYRVYPLGEARAIVYRSIICQFLAVPKTDRIHKRHKSEVLTSTPVKADHAIKFKKSNNKKTKISVSWFQQDKKKRCTKPDFYYLVCAERYISPPTDWIECNQFKRWAHEDCTSYVGTGSYFCDKCQD